MISKPAAFAALAAIVASGEAHAAVSISTAATQNMTCSGGVCAPTATDATLNVGDLENLLASGDVTVTTTGSGVQAQNMDVKAPVSWSSDSALTLDAHKSLRIDQPVSVQGLAALTLATHHGGKNALLSFGKSGNVTFANLPSRLVINSISYTLENSIKSLAAAIANDPSGAFALANSYDASGDGTYNSSPIRSFAGSFDGLGNSVSNLSIDVPDVARKRYLYVGFLGSLNSEPKSAILVLHGQRFRLKMIRREPTYLSVPWQD